jgi:hypothetical protein
MIMPLSLSTGECREERVKESPSTFNFYSRCIFADAATWLHVINDRKFAAMEVRPHT